MEDIKILGLDVHGPLFSVSHTDIRDQLNTFVKEIGKEDIREDFEHYLEYCKWSDERYDDMRKKIYSDKPIYNEKGKLEDTLADEMAYVEIMLHQYLVYTWTFIYNTLNKEEFARLKQRHIEETIKRKVDEAIPVLQELKDRGIERIIAVTSIPYTGECLKAAGFFGSIDKCCTSTVHETGAPMPVLFKKLRKVPEDSALYRNWKVVDIGLPTEDDKEFRLFYTTILLSGVSSCGVSDCQRRGCS